MRSEQHVYTRVSFRSVSPFKRQNSRDCKLKWNKHADEINKSYAFMVPKDLYL
jgi:hypothetical protein